MTEPNAGQRRHFHLKKIGQPERFQSTASSTREPRFPHRERREHGAALRGQLVRIQEQMSEAVQLQREWGKDNGLGLQIEFVSEPGFELAFEGLARGQQRIELLNVRYDGATQTHFATVYIPDGKLSAFESLIKQYLEADTSKGQPRNCPLLNPISEIRTATFGALWTDDAAALPATVTEPIWWEFWLPIRENQAGVLERFRTIARALNFQVSQHALVFPERTVVNVYGSQASITESMALLNEVAEIRRAKETAEFFDALTPFEQREWADELLQRSSNGAEDSVRICLLDTGVNPGHPLLANHVDMADLYTVDAGWGVQDDLGHGTGLAGIALYGDLTDPLASLGPVSINHRVESVKLLPNAQGYQSEPYGSLTISAVARPEIAAPNKRRIFSMAVTSTDDRDRGRPSAWSAAVDLLSSDSLGEREYPRLIVVSAGNADEHQYSYYPDSNLTDGIHDPGQAWNAICVGAYTQKITLDPPTPGEQAVAAHGSLSPYSTTSRTWQRTPWPLKPDVVFEGGNLVKDAYGIFSHTSLSLLTTSHQPQNRLFSTTWATSAASALAARMAAQISSAYPELWPETVRALMVHSAEWTERMKSEFLVSESKSDYEGLVRTCGFGVPDIGRALWSASNSLTLLVEDTLQPFARQGSKPATARDMHLHLLPWPQQELLNLGNVDVEMRVTLSYFIEPNPGVAERGLKGRYRYESHGLRFEVSRSGEDANVFRQRINKRARDEDDDSPYLSSASDSRWVMGTRGRHKGSVHSDIWRGPASDLAGLGMIGIYPAPGWWKTLVKQNKFNSEARYSLVVSIKTQQTTVDLYSAVDVAISNRIAIAN